MSLTHLTPQQFFGTAFWLGFSINYVFAEAWLNTRVGIHQTLTGASR
jgi:hypothetical protein